MLVLVDDNRLFRSALAANLREDGYEVLEFESGRSLRLERLKGIEALLCEYLIEREDGLALARRFHATFPAVPVVVITRATQELTRQAQAANLDYVTVLSKPLEYDVLSEVLRWLAPPAGH